MAGGRRRLLTEEKQETCRRDALNADRRRLPMVRIEKEYALYGPAGPAAWEESKGRSPVRQGT